ncbi:MAG: bifunctional glutamate N-acetyltransferase/amino-acid acetyltransferase ArgJ [Sedimenticolaceae bacterium]|jgi:glutamate N-acetyltransferase/amino-acid N-acetyltransferase
MSNNELMAGVGLSVSGVRLATAAAGIRYKNRKDVCLIELAQGGTAAGVFTKNKFCAAPVHVAKENLAKDPVRYLIINSGNANAGTGDEGMRAARETCRTVAALAGCPMSQVLPFSTGVIGQDLPILPFQQAMPSLMSELSEDGWEDAARTIMTTDTRPKYCSKQIELDGETITITGIAKGSGMIHPNMATMLGYVATDAKIDQKRLQSMLVKGVDPSFNSITVDGDTSTNDACVLLASGASGVEITDTHHEVFQSALNEVLFYLAREIVRDGEGATKLVEIAVEGAKDDAEAKAVAFTVAHSPLCKTAWFASDPNWGRVLAAVGRAPIDHLDIDALKIYLDDVLLVSDGGRAASYTEEQGQSVLNKDAFEIRVIMNEGKGTARVLTCDFSYDYVKINAEYRS